MDNIFTQNLSPRDARKIFRKGDVSRPTAGLCLGYAQCNLIILPQDTAAGFREFAAANPLSCPVLEESAAGARTLKYLAADCDIARDFPQYWVYEHGKLVAQPRDISHLWRDDFVAFFIGCSFSFEEALIEAGIPMRHIEEGRNVPMYITNIPCQPAGGFFGNMVVSMRPMTKEHAALAKEITEKMPKVHGGPVSIGDGRDIGIADVAVPDFGDSPTVKDGEVCVFWPCGVTPQAAVMAMAPPLAITHAPGHMFICDILNRDL